MKVETTIKYYKGYVPPKCRKTRYEWVEEKVWRKIRECSLSDIELALVAEGVNYYAYKGKLYTEIKLHKIYQDKFSSALDLIIRQGNIYSTYYANLKNRMGCRFDDPTEYETREDILKRLRKDLDCYLVIDGIPYQKTRVPFYRLVTFGCRGDGTGLFLETYRYPRNAVVGMRGLYFSALDYELAIEKANEVARSHGDFQQVGKFEKLIEVYKPEYIKRVPL